MSPLRYNEAAIENLVYQTYPPTECKHIWYYLKAQNSTRADLNPATSSSRAYNSESKDTLNFGLTFKTRTTTTGYHTQSTFHDDMGIFILLRKLDKHGHPLLRNIYPTSTPLEQMPEINVPVCQAFRAVMRSSLRTTAESASTLPWEISHSHDREKKLTHSKPVSLKFSTCRWGLCLRREKD